MATNSKFSLKIRDYIHTPERKREYNEQHFGEAARHYAFATRAMSLGRDMVWKRKLVAALPRFPAPVCVDLACGTGDVTLLLADRYPAGRVIGIDLTGAMLKLARQRSHAGNVEFLQQDMGATDLPDELADIVTGSYAVRNAPEFQQAFTEIYRILRPGGFVALLDFSKSPKPWFQKLQLIVLKYWCGLWGLILHRNPEVHSYIASSLKNFPDRIQLHNQLQECGFAISYSKRFYLGTLELLVLQKPGG